MRLTDKADRSTGKGGPSVTRGFSAVSQLALLGTVEELMTGSD